LISAERTRSRDSLKLRSGKPMIESEGVPGEASVSTRTINPSTPCIAQANEHESTPSYCAGGSGRQETARRARSRGPKGGGFTMVSARVVLVAAVAALAGATAGSAQSQTPPPAHITLYSTGVLVYALRAVSDAFTKQTGIVVDQTYGNTGKLRERIEAGENADVFGAGHTVNPQRLHDDGTFGNVTVIAHSNMCLLEKTSIPATRPVTDVMLDPSIRLVTGLLSPPHVDPSGDYAEVIYGKIDRERPGSKAVLDAKSLQLAGGTVPMPAGADVPTYLLLTGNMGDAFLAYCSNFVHSVAINPGRLRSQPMPADVAVQADFGLALRNGAPPAAVKFRDFLLSDAGQAIFVDAGFTRI
jgi:ABC-type molybdate transport system substrate-binding protein